MNINYSYLEPPSRASKIKHPKQFYIEKINKKTIRHIFQNVPYENAERQAINKLNQYLEKKEPNILYSDGLLLKFNYLGNFMISQAYQNIKKYQEWHHSEIITKITSSAKEILENGIFYSFGRDYQYCPIVYIFPSKIDLKKYQPNAYLNALHHLLTPLEEFMLVGGSIEKWIVIVDCQNKKCHLNLDLVKKCMKQVMHAYPFRLKKLIIVNYNNQLQPYFDMVAKFLQENNEIVRPQIIKNYQDLIDKIAIEERQKKYGGTLKNLNQFWPIHSTNKYQQQKTIMYEDEISETQYKTVINDQLLFQGDNSTPICDISNGKCEIY